MPRYQFRHAYVSFTTVVLSVGLFAIALIFEIKNIPDELWLNPASLKPHIIDLILNYTFGLIIINSTITVAINIVFTHRVFGALFVIERFLKSYKENPKSQKKLHLRKSSQTGEIASLLNSILFQDDKT